MESSLDISNNLPLTNEQKSSYITRMKAAWARLPDEKKAELKPMLDEANQQYADFVANKTPPQHKFHNILRMKSYLTNDWDGRSKQRLRSSLGRRERFLGPENTSSLIRAGNWLRVRYGSKICCTSIRFHRAHPR